MASSSMTASTRSSSTEVYHWESFVHDWARDKYFYAQAATIAAELCEGLLASNGIRGIVTHRVKQGKRLEAKLRERVNKKGKVYTNSDAVRNDIVDLTGVRIALYFPSDGEKIKKSIGEAFSVVQHVKLPEHNQRREEEEELAKSEVSGNGDASQAFQQRFGGYFADHYRVRMRVENMATIQLREDFKCLNPMIEIQVASVLMHAWAEVDHDLMYKTLTSGVASRQELHLLDAINGLAHTGEILLQELQIAVDNRVSYQKTSFVDQYELRSFLKVQPKLAKNPMDHIDVLYQVLKIVKLDSPLELAPRLEGWSPKKDSKSPVAISLLHHILTSLEWGNLRKKALNLRDESISLAARNIETMTIDGERRRGFISLCESFQSAVAIADLLRFPKKSILVLDGLEPMFSKFHMLYNPVVDIHRRLIKATTLKEDFPRTDIDAMAKLWVWFERNPDMLFKVSLRLAALEDPKTVAQLQELHSGWFQRQWESQDEIPETQEEIHDEVRVARVVKQPKSPLRPPDGPYSGPSYKPLYAATSPTNPYPPNPSYPPPDRFSRHSLYQPYYSRTSHYPWPQPQARWPMSTNASPAGGPYAPTYPYMQYPRYNNT